MEYTKFSENFLKEYSPFKPTAENPLAEGDYVLIKRMDGLTRLGKFKHESARQVKAETWKFQKESGNRIPRTVGDSNTYTFYRRDNNPKSLKMRHILVTKNAKR